MVDEATDRVLWVWTGTELVGVLALLVILVAGLFDRTTLFTSASRQLRIAAVAFLIVELLIPLWVYVDVRRRTDDPNAIWIHAAAMPLVNFFGLVGYLADRYGT